MLACAAWTLMHSCTPDVAEGVAAGAGIGVAAVAWGSGWHWEVTYALVVAVRAGANPPWKMLPRICPARTMPSHAAKARVTASQP
jgi:hypothetical protein